MAECPDSTPTKSIERVCVSPSLKEQICLLCAKVVSNSDFRRKLTTSGGRKKTKTCFNLESILGKEISSDCFLTNILCRNCADKNETLVRKLHGVRESLESSRKPITEEKGGITSVNDNLTFRYTVTLIDEDTFHISFSVTKNVPVVVKDRLGTPKYYFLCQI